MEARQVKLGGWLVILHPFQLFQSYQDNGRVAGHFGPVQTPGFFWSYSLSFRWFGPGCFCQILLGPFGPLLIFNNFLANETFF